MKRVISFVLSLSLIFNNYLFAIEGYYDVNNTMPNKPNAECYFVFDRLASPECEKLYNDNGGDIRKMMNNENLFYKCLVGNCGLYQTDSDHYEQSYQYMMEVVKKCVLDKEDDLTYGELAKSDWFVNLATNLGEEPRIDTHSSKTRFIPFKVFKYKCPKFKKIDYQQKERVLQYPVLCFKNEVSSSLKNTIINCLEHRDTAACQQMNQEVGGNLKAYIKYLYCDKDTDGDGFPESLSSALQAQCNRSDAASLRCTKDQMCSTIVRCVENGEKTVKSYEYKTCKALKRHYREYTLGTQCGDVSDIYQNNPNCIRINNVTDAREKGLEYYRGTSTKNLNEPIRFIEVKNFPSDIDMMHSYHEYILYQKDNGEVKKRFVALVYPEALYKKKKSLTALGKFFNVMSGGLVAHFEGVSDSVFGPGAIGAGFVTKKKDIPNTIIDNVLREAIENGYTVTTNKDVKGVTYKVKTGHGGLLSKKAKMYFMKAWWDPTLVYNTNLAGTPNPSDWIWDGYKRKNIHYYFKIKAHPNDVLVFYGINAKKDKYITPDTYYKLHSDVKCTANGVSTSYEWKKMQTAANYAIPSPSIQNMTIFLTYPSLYLFQFFKDDDLVFSVYKDFTTGDTYPSVNLDISSLESKSDNFSSKLTELYNSKKESIVNDTVDEYMEKTETKNLIDKLIKSLMDTFKYRNIDEVKRRERDFTEYSYFKDFYDFYRTKKVLDYYVENAFKDNVCFFHYDGDDRPEDPGNEVTATDDETLENLNDDIQDFSNCFNANSTKSAEVNNSVNADSELLELDQKRFDKLKELTQKVYEDFTKTVKDNVNGYLNKSPTGYSLNNDMGSWTMSFKSACGDYTAAKTNAETHYADGIASITADYFSSDIDTIGRGLINLIDSHMDDVTLRYKYKIMSRTGTTKWDNWHPAVAGGYSCTYYTYYESDDNNGNSFKRVTDLSSGKYFNSYGGYVCDRKNLSPTGNPNKYCQTSDHDLRHFNYKFVGYGYWTSTAKKLDVTTTRMKELEDDWLRSKHYRDYSFVSDTIWAADEKGYNNVRVKLSTDPDNGIAKESDKYIKPFIKTYVTNLVKDFLKEKIKFELDNGISGDDILDTVKDRYLRDLFATALEESDANHDFKSFNKVVIKDILADPDSPYAINYTIETPDGILIKNADALNIVMLSFPEVRKYRCYDDFENCSYANEDGCTLDDTFDYNYVSDFTGKRIATLRKETYKCEKEVRVPACKKYQVEKSCYNTKIGYPFIEFDDNDFSKDFGKAVGENLVFNEALTIFNGRELQCQRGLFTDFSWLTDPAFLMQMGEMALGYIAQNTPAGQALKEWLSGEKDAANPCASAWLNCMDSHNSGVSQALQTGNSAASTCDNQVRGIEGCHAFSGVSNLSKAINQRIQNQIISNLPGADPTTLLAMQIAYNLAFNTFDKCNQCKSRKCASSHKPKSAETLYKMTNGKAELITGVEYGLGPDFKAYGQCFFKNSGCARHLFGMCIRKKENYCCYNTLIARILAGQMYEQLGYTFERDGCSAIKITDLPKIDFSPCPDGVIPSPSNKCINYKELEDYIDSKINWNIKGIFDMNKLIQAVMDMGGD